MDNIQVLKLDSLFQPMEVIDWREAFILTWMKKAYAVEYTDFFVHSAKKSFQIPSIVALFVHVSHELFRIPCSKANILLRDDHKCQYCGAGATKSSILTIDHVIPRSKGGETEWNNVVAACSLCNQAKSNKILSKTSLKLSKRPKKPTYGQLTKKKMRNINDNWLRYL